jgi:GntR family transcriptional regulator
MDDQMNCMAQGGGLGNGSRIMPLYAQIAGLLRAQLESGQFARGSYLPSIDLLSGRFRVAPQTLRQAIAVLEDEGLVQRRQGIGTLVCAVPRDQRWLSLPTDWDALIGMLEELHPERTLIEDADRLPDDVPGGGLQESYRFFRRVHARDGLPFCVIDIFLESGVFHRAPDVFRSELVILALSRLPGIRIGDVRQTLRLDVADRETAGLLGIAMAGPIARVRRIIRDEDGHILYLADVAYRGDVVALDMDLTPKHLC